MYVHALPPGFVLKAKKIDPDDEEEGTPIEEIIEEQVLVPVVVHCGLRSCRGNNLLHTLQ